MRAGRVATPLGGVVAAAALFAGTRGLDDVAQGGQLGPAFWPRLTLIGLALACAAKAIEEWRRPEVGPTLDDAAPPADVSRGRLFVAVALLVLYAAAIPMLGFMLATAAFTVAFMWRAGARSIAGVVTATVLVTVGLLYVFVRVVYLPLPKGQGPFEGITIAVYRLLGIF